LRVQFVELGQEGAAFLEVSLAQANEAQGLHREQIEMGGTLRIRPVSDIRRQFLPDGGESAETCTDGYCQEGGIGRFFQPRLAKQQLVQREVGGKPIGIDGQPMAEHLFEMVQIPPFDRDFFRIEPPA